jgi:hypothetical protein
MAYGTQLLFLSLRCHQYCWAAQTPNRGYHQNLYYISTLPPICHVTPLRYPNSYYIPPNCHQLNICGYFLAEQWGNTGLTGSVTTQYLKTTKNKYIIKTTITYIQPLLTYTICQYTSCINFLQLTTHGLVILHTTNPNIYILTIDHVPNFIFQQAISKPNVAS